MINLDKNICIYFMDGRCMFSDKVPGDQGYFFIHRLPRGTFLLLVEVDGRNYSKILIAH